MALLPRLIGAALKPAELAGQAINVPFSGSATVTLARTLLGHDGLEGAVHGRVVLVTGASSGIGAATARRLGAAGASVVLVARRRAALEAVAADVVAAGGAATVCPCDLSDLDAVDALVAQALETTGGVDVLVNCAGRSIRRSLELSYDRFHDYERTMALNYFGPVRLTLGLLPAMRERRRGQVVNVSSAGVQGKAPRFGAYIASKAALDTLADAWQAETQDERIRFTTVNMPLVRTPMISPTTLYDRFPALTPEQAAAVVCQAIVDRPRRVSSAAGRAVSLADSLNPQLMDVVRRLDFRLFPDSDAARGEQG